jgi:hypothetical protein
MSFVRSCCRFIESGSETKILQAQAQRYIKEQNFVKFRNSLLKDEKETDSKKNSQLEIHTLQ